MVNFTLGKQITTNHHESASGRVNTQLKSTPARAEKAPEADVIEEAEMSSKLSILARPEAEQRLRDELIDIESVTKNGSAPEKTNEALANT